jgi:hypothetical protein
MLQVYSQLHQAVEAHMVVRRRNSHIFYTIGSQLNGEVVSLARRPPFAPQEDY